MVRYFSALEVRIAGKRFSVPIRCRDGSVFEEESFDMSMEPATTVTYGPESYRVDRHPRGKYLLKSCTKVGVLENHGYVLYIHSTLKGQCKVHAQ